MVVYDDCSGDTVKLDVVMAEIFHRLSAAPATLEELSAHLAEVLDLKGDRRLRSVTDTALRRLAASGLIERDDATLVTSIPG